MKTQNDRVLAYLERHGSINAMQALSELGIYRLAARIADLKNAGHAIESRAVDVTNRFGEACRVAEYRLHAGGQTQ